MEQQKKFKKWEKIFIIINTIVIVFLCVFYAYRLIHYYNEEHAVVKDNKLLTYLVKNNVVYTGEGLYETDKDNEYYYKGKNINNYVWYSGRLWRVISISKDSIKLITEENQTSLVWGYTNEYSTSYIRSWLNTSEKDNTGIFLKSLLNYENYLVNSKWCVDKVTTTDSKCNNYSIDDYVGLLSVEEYLKAGGKDSYLNNNSYWWTSNVSDDNKVWYVFNHGGINNESLTSVSYYSYGVRPVVNVKADTMIYSGDGTLEDPYVITNESSAMLEHKSVGNYVNYFDYKWRIVDKSETYVKLIMDGYIQKDNDNYQLNYSDGNSNYSNSNTLIKYLNSTFYNSLDKNKLKTCDFYYGTYGSSTQYDYSSAYNQKANSYVGIPTIGSLFITDYNKYWLTNNQNSSLALAYIMNEQNGLFADSVTNKNYIRPVVCVSKDLLIASGNGMKNSPYVLGD